MRSRPSRSCAWRCARYERFASARSIATMSAARARFARSSGPSDRVARPMSAPMSWSRNTIDAAATDSALRPSVSGMPALDCCAAVRRVSADAIVRAVGVVPCGHVLTPPLRDARFAFDPQLERVARAGDKSQARLLEAREDARELLGSHRRAQRDRKRRGAGAEVTHVQRADDRKRLDAPLDPDETPERLDGREHELNVARR